MNGEYKDSSSRLLTLSGNILLLCSLVFYYDQSVYYHIMAHSLIKKKISISHWSTLHNLYILISNKHKCKFTIILNCFYLGSWRIESFCRASFTLNTLICILIPNTSIVPLQFSIIFKRQWEIIDPVVPYLIDLNFYS